MKDVGQVHDGWLVQQNIVREDGKRSVLLSIIKNGNASTLDVVNAVEGALHDVAPAAPPGMQINELFDQSVFVKPSVDGVLREGAIAAGLTALMILLFLGSWRSTLVVMISIPLSILTSLVVLYFLGETLNTMTLGGLALAVGILVDDSTVTIENTHRLLTRRAAAAAGDAARRRRHRRADAGLDARDQLRVHLGGLPGRAGQISVHAARPRRRVRDAGLLRPVADADADHHRPAAQGRAAMAPPTAALARLVRAASTAASSAVSSACAPATSACSPRLLDAAHRRPDRRRRWCWRSASCCSSSSAATSFRLIDGGQIQLHVRAPAGTRIEKTEQIFQAVEDKIREVIPEQRPQTDRRQYRPAGALLQLAFTDGSTIGVNDGVILVSLKDGHAPTADYVRKLREVLPAAFPEDMFYFQAADIVTQILNFGLPAQIDVRTVGYDRANNLRVAKELRRRIAAIPGHCRRPSAAGGRCAGASMPRSTARAPRSSASTPAPSPPTSTSA